MGEDQDGKSWLVYLPPFSARVYAAQSWVCAEGNVFFNKIAHPTDGERILKNIKKNVDKLKKTEGKRAIEEQREEYLNRIQESLDEYKHLSNIEIQNESLQKEIKQLRKEKGDLKTEKGDLNEQID